MPFLTPSVNGSAKEPNKFHNYETEKITRKASDMAEYIELFGSSTRDRHAFSERPPIYASLCMIISGGRTEQLYIIAGFLLRRWLFRLLKTSTDICVVHDDLGWKNRTTRCNRFWRAGCSGLEYVDIRLVY